MAPHPTPTTMHHPQQQLRRRRLPLQTSNSCGTSGSSIQKQQQQTQKQQRSYRRSTLESDSLAAAARSDEDDDDDDEENHASPPPHAAASVKTRRRPSLASQKRRVIADDSGSEPDTAPVVVLDKENKKGCGVQTKVNTHGSDRGMDKGGVWNGTVKNDDEEEEENASSDNDESTSSSVMSGSAGSSKESHACLVPNRAVTHDAATGTIDTASSLVVDDVSNGDDGASRLSVDTDDDDDSHDSYASDEQSRSSNSTTGSHSPSVSDESAYEPDQDETVHWSTTQHHQNHVHDDGDDDFENQTRPVAQSTPSQRARRGYRAKIWDATQTTLCHHDDNDDSVSKDDTDNDDSVSKDDDDDLDPDLVIDDQDELRFARSSVSIPLLLQHHQINNDKSDSCLSAHDNDTESRTSTQIIENNDDDDDKLHVVCSLPDRTSVSHVDNGGSVTTFHGTTEMELIHDDQDNQQDDDDSTIEDSSDTVVRSVHSEILNALLDSDVIEAGDGEDEGSDGSSYDEVVAELIDTDAEPAVETIHSVNGASQLASSPPRGITSDMLAAATVNLNDNDTMRPPTEITVSYTNCDTYNNGDGGIPVVPMSPLVDDCFRRDKKASSPVEYKGELEREFIIDDDAMSGSLVPPAENIALTNKSSSTSSNSNYRTRSPRMECQRMNNQTSSSVVDASEMPMKECNYSVHDEVPCFQSPLRCDRSSCDTNAGRDATNKFGRDTVSIGEVVVPHASTPLAALELSVLCNSIGTLSIDRSLTYSPVPSVNPQSDVTGHIKHVTKLMRNTSLVDQTKSGGETKQRAHQPVKGRRFRREGRIKRGKWKFGAKIGSGAFGVVHVGMNTETGAFIAIKSLKMEPSVMKDAEREVDLLKSLRHENIVRYLGAEMDSKNLHIFQEWVPGGSIDSMLAKFGPFPLVVLRNYLEQILRGIQYLHGSNIMHRDIKGSNILVNDEGVVKLADFGAGKRFQQLKCDMMMSLTMRGTPYFMAPEVFQEKYSTKADIWSVACVAVQMATGSPPWKKLGFTNPVTLFHHITSTTHVPGVEFDGSVGLLEGSPHVVLFTSVLESCFHRQPESRPNARTLLEDVFFTTESNTALDDISECRGLFSPESRGSTFCISPLRGSLSPMRPPTRRRNSVASSPALRCFSPPLPLITMKHAIQSPFCDSADWPTWARKKLSHGPDPAGVPIQKSTASGQHTSALLKDSLEYSDDSSERRLGSNTSLFGLKFARSYTQSSP